LVIRESQVRKMNAARQNVRLRSRDRVANGRLLPKSVDLRSAAGRRFRHLVGAYEAELGPERSESQRGLVRQIATLQIQIERIQADIVAGLRVVDSDEVIRLSSEHRRLLTALKGIVLQNSAGFDFGS
jgi:hypothetical protein